MRSPAGASPSVGSISSARRAAAVALAAQRLGLPLPRALLVGVEADEAVERRAERGGLRRLEEDFVGPVARGAVARGGTGERGGGGGVRFAAGGEEGAGDRRGKEFAFRVAGVGRGELALLPVRPAGGEGERLVRAAGVGVGAQQLRGGVADSGGGAPDDLPLPLLRGVLRHRRAGDGLRVGEAAGAREDRDGPDGRRAAGAVRQGRCREGDDAVERAGEAVRFAERLERAAPVALVLEVVLRGGIGLFEEVGLERVEVAGKAGEVEAVALERLLRLLAGGGVAEEAGARLFEPLRAVGNAGLRVAAEERRGEKVLARGEPRLEERAPGVVRPDDGEAAAVVGFLGEPQDDAPVVRGERRGERLGFGEAAGVEIDGEQRAERAGVLAGRASAVRPGEGEDVVVVLAALVVFVLLVLPVAGRRAARLGVGHALADRAERILRRDGRVEQRAHLRDVLRAVHQAPREGGFARVRQRRGRLREARDDVARRFVGVDVPVELVRIARVLVDRGEQPRRDRREVLVGKVRELLRQTDAGAPAAGVLDLAHQALDRERRAPRHAGIVHRAAQRRDRLLLPVRRQRLRRRQRRERGERLRRAAPAPAEEVRRDPQRREQHRPTVGLLLLSVLVLVFGTDLDLRGRPGSRKEVEALGDGFRFEHGAVPDRGHLRRFGGRIGGGRGPRDRLRREALRALAEARADRVPARRAGQDGKQRPQLAADRGRQGVAVRRSGLGVDRAPGVGLHGEREVDGGEPGGGVDRAARLGLAVLERADGEQEPVPAVRFRGGLRLGSQRGGDDRLRADDGGRIGRGRVRGGVFRPRRDERREGEEGKQQGCLFHGCRGWWLVVSG